MCDTAALSIIFHHFSASPEARSSLAASDTVPAATASNVRLVVAKVSPTFLIRLCEANEVHQTTVMVIINLLSQSASCDCCCSHCQQCAPGGGQRP